MVSVVMYYRLFQCCLYSSVSCCCQFYSMQVFPPRSGNGHNAGSQNNSPTFNSGQVNGLPAVFFQNSNLSIDTTYVAAQEYLVFRSGRYRRQDRVAGSIQRCNRI